MFYTKVTKTGQNVKLAPGDNLEIYAKNSDEVYNARVEFISGASGAHNIFVILDDDNASRAIFKVYSNRTMRELIVYYADTVKCITIENVIVVDPKDSTNKVLLKLNNGLDLSYYSDSIFNEWVPASVGDVVKYKLTPKDDYTIRCISSNGKSVFLENEAGNAIMITHDMTIAIESFDSFKWK